MARRRKRKNSPQTGAVWAVAVLIAAALAYYAARGGEAAGAGEETDVAAYDSAADDSGTPYDERTGGESSAPVAAKKAGRARGAEIPAYLTDRDEEIVSHEGFTLSYNKKRLVPNWVAWVLTKERTRGTEKRANDFQPDFSIKKGPIAYDSDYRGSGYDRGHMCPSADCKHSREAMTQCFLLSNMCPQTHKLNAGDWEELETLCRKWAVAYDSIYIVCGPVIEKGVEYKTIGENGVTVPEQFYKVVLRRTGERSAEAIGFIMNNDDSDRPVASYAVTVDSVEKRTGINFFSKLPRDVERRAEASANPKLWKGLVK